MWNTSIADGGFGSGWGFGGGGGAAFAGALVGGLVGDALWPGGGYGRRGGYDGDGGHNKVVQVNGGWGPNGIGQWELFKEMSDTRREVALNPFLMENAVLQQTIANNAQLQSLMSQIACASNQTQKEILVGQFQNALQLAGISREICECCCKQMLAITTMGFETQLRDQAMHNENMLAHSKTQCMIKDTANEQRIYALERENRELRDHGQTRTLVDAIGAASGRLGVGINQIGVNQVNTAPTTSQWPPAFFGFWPSI